MARPSGWVYIRKPHSEGGFRKEADKMRVAATYISTGNYALTARLCEIPLVTVKSWKKQPWWTEMLRQMQIQEKVETNKQLLKVRDKALSVVADRLENGNFQLDQKTGQIRRIPVSARDAHRIASDFIDKEDLLQQRINQLSQAEETNTQNTLKQLAEAFAEMAAKGKKEPSTLDVEDVSFVEDIKDD